MKTKNNIFFPIIFSTLLAVSSFSAQAVNPNTPNGGARSVARTNHQAGASFLNMTPSASTFCFLSKVNFEDIDTNNEFAECKVTRGAVVWTLTATLGAGGGPDAEARCSAYCYNN
jgi:hypothetical protein